MNKQLEEKLNKVIHSIAILQASVMEGTRRIEAMSLVVDTQGKLVDKLSDKLVEMAMVNQGMGREAASHRRSQTVEDPIPPLDSSDELWDEGCDVITMP